MGTILQFFKSKLIAVASNVNLSDIMNKAESAIEKSDNAPIAHIKRMREPSWQTKVPFTFFYGGGKFQPIYAWIFLFCSLSASMLFVKIYASWKAIGNGTFTADTISTTDIATVLTFVLSMIALYNMDRKNKIKYESPVESMPTEMPVQQEVEQVKPRGKKR